MSTNSTPIVENALLLKMAYGLILMETSGSSKVALNFTVIKGPSGAKSGVSLGFTQIDLNNNKSNSVLSLIDDIMSAINGLNISEYNKNEYKKILTETSITDDEKDFVTKNEHEISSIFASSNNIRNNLIDLDNTNIYSQLDKIQSLLHNIDTCSPAMLSDIMQNGVIQDTIESRRIMIGLIEWSNQSGGLTQAGATTGQNSFIQFIKNHGGILTEGVLKSYISSQTYFVKSGNFTKWWQNIVTNADISDTFVNAHVQTNTQDGDPVSSLLKFLVNSAHATTIAYMSILEILTAKYQADPIIITKGADALYLWDSQYSSFYQTNINGMQGQSGWVDADAGSFFLVQKNNQQYQQLSLSDLFKITGGHTITAQQGDALGLYVWDGKSTYTALTDFGISSLNPNLMTDSEVVSGNSVSAINRKGISYADGTTGIIAQVGLNISTTYVKNPLDSTNTSSIAIKTNLHGYGVIASLLASETLSPALQSDVAALQGLNYSTASYQQFSSLLQSMLKDWEDTATLNIPGYGVLEDSTTDDNSLQFMEKYIGAGSLFRAHKSYTTIAAPAQSFVHDAYNRIEKTYGADFVLQTSLGTSLSMFAYDENTDTVTTSEDFATILGQLNSLWSDVSNTSSLHHNLAADLILAASFGNQESLGDIYLDMATVNADEATALLDTAQGITMDGTSEIQEAEGGKTYTFSTDVDKNIEFDFRYGLVANVAEDTLVIDADEANTTITVSNGIVKFIATGHTLSLTEAGMANIGTVQFLDKTDRTVDDDIVSELNINGTTYLSSGMNNLEIPYGQLVALQSIQVSYDFQEDANLSIDENNVVINLTSSKTFSFSDITGSNGIYSITDGTHTLTIDTQTTGIATIQSNGTTIANIGKDILDNTALTSSAFDNIVNNITQPGYYSYVKSNYDTFNISAHSGTDVIELSGYTGRPFENLIFNKDMTVTQNSQNTIIAKDSNQTIIFDNTMELPTLTNINSDINTINNLGLSSYYFDMQKFGSVIFGGYVGNFKGIATSDVTDVTVSKGTTTNVTDPDGHSLFYEEQNRYGDNVNVTTQTQSYFDISSPYGTASFNISAIKDGDNIDIQTTSPGLSTHDYVIVDAFNPDWGSFTVSLDGQYGRYLLGTGTNDFPLTYNQEGNENIALQSLISNDIVNLTGASGVVSDTTRLDTVTYHITGGGAYSISVNAIDNEIYDTNSSSLMITGNETGISTIYLPYSYTSAKWSINQDFSLTGTLSTGSTVTIDNFFSNNGISVRIGTMGLRTTNLDSFSGTYSQTLDASKKVENISLYTGATGSFTDHVKATTELYDYSTSGIQNMSISGTIDLSLSGSDTVNIEEETSASNVVIRNGNATDIALSNDTLTYNMETNKGETHVSIADVLKQDGSSVELGIQTNNTSFDALKEYVKGLTASQGFDTFSFGISNSAAVARTSLMSLPKETHAVGSLSSIELYASTSQHTAILSGDTHHHMASNIVSLN